MVLTGTADADSLGKDAVFSEKMEGYAAMQTIIGQFGSQQDMEAALQALQNYQVGPTETAVKAKKGFMQWFWSGGLSWDLLAQAAIVIGIVVGAFFGALAGAGVFGHLGHAASAGTVVAGIFTGISIGMLAGFTFGSFAGAFVKEPVRFVPQPLSERRLVVAVHAPNRYAHDAVELMEQAHATHVETLPGDVPVEAMVANLPDDEAA